MPPGECTDSQNIAHLAILLQPAAVQFLPAAGQGCRAQLQLRRGRVLGGAVEVRLVQALPLVLQPLREHEMGLDTFLRSCEKTEQRLGPVQIIWAACTCTANGPRNNTLSKRRNLSFMHLVYGMTPDHPSSMQAAQPVTHPADDLELVQLMLSRQMRTL